MRWTESIFFPRNGNCNIVTKEKGSRTTVASHVLATCASGHLRLKFTHITWEEAALSLSTSHGGPYTPISFVCEEAVAITVHKPGGLSTPVPSLRLAYSVGSRL